MNRILREGEHLAVFEIEEGEHAAFIRPNVDLETAEKVLAMVADAYATQLDADADKLLDAAKYRLVEMSEIQRIDPNGEDGESAEVNQ